MSIELTIVLGVFILLIAAGVFYLLKRVEDQNNNQVYIPPAYSKEELDNILIIRFDARLYFANCNYFKDFFYQKLAEH